MPDYIVNSHIDAFLKTDTLSGARDSLGVPGVSDLVIIRTTAQGAPTGTVNADFTGQKCRVGDNAPYTWYVALTTGAGVNTWQEGLESASSILNKLKGEAPLTNRIGVEYFPPVMEFDYIYPGESGTNIYPEGAITRAGSSLRIHDGITPGGNSLTTESIIPQVIEKSGVAYITTLEDPLVKNSQNQPFYWAFMCEVTIPAAWNMSGTKLSIILETDHSTSIAQFQRSAGLITKTAWDEDSLPVTNTPTFPFTVLDGGSTRGWTKHFRVVEIVSDDQGNPTLSLPLSGSTAHGRNYTAATDMTSFNQNTLKYKIASNYNANADLVLIMPYTNNSQQSPVRSYAYRLTIQKI